VLLNLEARLVLACPSWGIDFSRQTLLRCVFWSKWPRPWVDLGGRESGAKRPIPFLP